MKIYSCRDPEFREYGRVVTGLDLAPVMEILGRRECPEGGVLYVPSDPEMEKTEAAEQIRDVLCGTLPMQIGYTNGHNRKLNALEYHRDSEFNIADQDIILLLAKRSDLADDFTMDTSKVKAFRIPKGVLVEVYATSLHYAPCQTTDAGYRCLVVLPRGTNLPLKRQPSQSGEDRLLAAANKWLIAHPDGGCGEGSFPGLRGENLEV